MGLLETILVILFAIWLFGLLLHVGGSLINILLVILLIGIIYKVYTGRNPA